MANVILPETTLELSKSGGLYGCVLPNPLTLVAGNTYTVTYNGESYVCQAVYDNSAIPGMYLGNMDGVLFNGNDTGEPFAMISADSGMTALYDLNKNTTATISIVESEEPEPDTATYRWKVENNALVSIGKNDNPITTIEGGIVNGVFDNARYQLTTPFNLLHDKDWAVEWRMSGDVTCDAAMAKIWDESGKQTDRESESILFRKTSKSVTLTSYGSTSTSSATHIHHGVQLDKYGIDYTVEHIYRLENRVNADGTNMVWLYVDGVEVAPMRHTFSNGGDEGNTDWVVGRDFSFGYMGVPRYIMSGFIMDDIAVWESGASEVFPEEQPKISRGALYLLYRIFSPDVFHAMTGKWHWLD